ncbi:hypothetical protein CEXT_480811 [Caerostris extrusa]|uniref:Uncharacterized protein n=1 Tax=Caerostris extrusa TaxID=172846 RepID=A0AAV4VYJ3_CAEEX|nr:hypothetical protein CEXT_480811 [Caerostris extrusa]
MKQRNHEKKKKSFTCRYFERASQNQSPTHHQENEDDLTSSCHGYTSSNPSDRVLRSETESLQNVRMFGGSPVT